MSIVVKCDYMVCVDCLMCIANGDDSGMSKERAEEGWQAIEREQAQGDQLVAGDGEADHEFSWSPCDCCSSRLGGSRHEVHVLGEAACSRLEVRELFTLGKQFGNNNQLN